jgi:hypothetical protein
LLRRVRSETPISRFFATSKVAFLGLTVSVAAAEAVPFFLGLLETT